MNDLVRADEHNMLMDLTTATTSYSSLAPQTAEEKKMFFNLINGDCKRLSDCINMEIPVRNVYCETVTFINEESGEATPGVRTLFFTEGGEAYQASSKGVFNALRKLFSVMGEPGTWEGPVTIIPKSINKGKNRILTFTIK